MKIEHISLTKVNKRKEAPFVDGRPRQNKNQDNAANIVNLSEYIMQTPGRESSLKDGKKQGSARNGELQGKVHRGSNRLTTAFISGKAPLGPIAELEDP